MPRLTDENQIVQFLRDQFGGSSSLLKKGIGDDAAVICPIPKGEYLVITTDMLLEEIDFRREWTTPLRLGNKSIAVNVSDLASMGARPLFYTISLAIPSAISRRWIGDFYRGLAEPAFSAGIQLIGGDLSHTENGIAISITALGQSARRKILYRSGGRAGDAVYVTGVLGRSAAGLRLLEQGCLRPRSRFQKEAMRVHQSPEPRSNAGQWLAQCGFVHCMMDLSDGLSSDLPRMCAASGVGAEIQASALPIFQPALSWGCNPLELALHGGEDFELLFAVPHSKCRPFEESYPSNFPKITRIGTLTKDTGKIGLIEPGKSRRLLLNRGYDHFRSYPKHKKQPLKRNS